MTKKGAVESMQEGHHDLENSLRLAVKEPKHIQTKDGGALLALCVHCEPPVIPLKLPEFCDMQQDAQSKSP